MRDAAIRVELGISLRRAAKLADVSPPTLRVYEIDPLSVRHADKRESCARLYSQLRGLLRSLSPDAVPEAAQ